MKQFRRILASALLLSSWCNLCRADVVTDWNETAVAAGYAAHATPDWQARNLAIVHLAMFEVLNSIEPRYRPYRARLQVEAGLSRDAAAAAAAHLALVRLYPGQAKELDAALRASLASEADGPAREGGIRLGEQAADALLAERASDGSAAPNTYRPFTVPGRYVPTAATASSAWGKVRPFGLKSCDQFRPSPPYSLKSAQWAKDFNEIKALGAKTGSARTTEQTDVARFWELTGPATTYPVTRQVSAAMHLDTLDNARLFALTAMATADAAIAVFDAKYTFEFWRPVTAIRNADIDGNDATELDAGWESLIPTPMHPEYPCAHCIFQGSSTAVLRALYGDAFPQITLTSTTAPGVVRNFDRLSDVVADVINGRVYGGLHFRTSGETGAEMGRQIGEYTVRSYLRPL